MLPFHDSPALSSPTLEAIDVARRLLDEAEGDARALAVGVDALADATDWQARATDDYRAGVAVLGEGLRLLVGRIAASLFDLAIAERVEVARAAAQG